MQKKRVLVSYDKLSPEIRTALQQQYPDGYTDHIMRIESKTPFYAVLLELSNVAYLIKVNLQEMFRYQVEGDDLPEPDLDDLEDDSFFDDEN